MFFVLTQLTFCNFRHTQTYFQAPKAWREASTDTICSVLLLVSEIKQLSDTNYNVFFKKSLGFCDDFAALQTERLFSLIIAPLLNIFQACPSIRPFSLINFQGFYDTMQILGCQAPYVYFQYFANPSRLNSACLDVREKNQSSFPLNLFPPCMAIGHLYATLLYECLIITRQKYLFLYELV